VLNTVPTPITKKLKKGLPLNRNVGPLYNQERIIMKRYIQPKNGSRINEMIRPIIWIVQAA